MHLNLLQRRLHMSTRVAAPLLACLLCSGQASPVLTSPPIQGLRASDIHDTFQQSRGAVRHEAIDIIEPRGTPVHAVVRGTVIRLFLSKPGGNTIYQFDEDRVFCYYYAHLDRYADGLREGMNVAAGDVIGYVGSSGNASPLAPHLHFAIFKLARRNIGGKARPSTLMRRCWNWPGSEPLPSSQRARILETLQAARGPGGVSVELTIYFFVTNVCGSDLRRDKIPQGGRVDGARRINRQLQTKPAARTRVSDPGW